MFRGRPLKSEKTVLYVHQLTEFPDDTVYDRILEVTDAIALLEGVKGDTFKHHRDWNRVGVKVFACIRYHGQ